MVREAGTKRDDGGWRCDRLRVLPDDLRSRLRIDWGAKHTDGAQAKVVSITSPSLNRVHAPQPTAAPSIERHRPEVNPAQKAHQVSSPLVPPVVPRKMAFDLGVEVELVGPSEGMIVLCADESIFVAYRSKTRNFTPGKELFGVSPSVLATVLADKGDRLQVKVLNGSWKDRMGWISSDEVRLRPTREDASGDVVEGLTLDKRREIYAELHRVGMLATFESEHQVPISEFAADPSQAGVVLDRHEAVYKELNKKGRVSLVAKYRQYRIDGAHLERIEKEGDEKRWPLPNVANPYRH